MSDRTLDVMKEHLHIAETYIKSMKNAESKTDFMSAIDTCRNSILKQYSDLEEIADDYTDKILGKKDQELHRISCRVGDIFGKEVTVLYGKMAPYMADEDFMHSFAEFDRIIGSNPLFGKNEFGHDVAVQVSKAMAGSMDGIAARMMADSSDTDEESLEKITDVMQRFLDLSRKYVTRMDDASTPKKAVTATDSYVSSIEKMIPEMKACADNIRLIMAKKDKPRQITDIADELKNVLGENLKDVMKNKQELLSEKKVQKSVGKLGDILNKVPF